jgi:hypothetical protein
MLAWVRNSPTFDNNTEEEIENFVDKNITCQLPEDDEPLKNLLLLVQKHTHSVACRKHGKACRFQFPRFPVRKTTAFKPLDDLPSAAIQEIYQHALKAVSEQIKDIDTTDNMSFDDLLQKSGISEDVYMQALRWVKTKHGQPAILLQRNPNESNINHYNTILMKCWEANLDVQYVTNTYACVMYVASYVSKPEKTLGDVLKAVSQSSVHLGVKTSMKTVAKKFLTHREISAQEAVYRLLSLPLVQGSRQVVFIATDLPHKRTRLFKPMKVLQQLEDDDPDVFMVSSDNLFIACSPKKETQPPNV